MLTSPSDVPGQCPSTVYPDLSTISKPNVWDIYFAQVVGMQMHPGYEYPMSVQDCATYADNMLRERQKRCL